ncbi:MAG TPA: hypothetical protein VFC67_02900 [Prolixibacteraceae bacterium]|nr:hypothetical protein [Prolixibacteraceae bacterium]
MHIDVKVSVWKRIELPESATKEEIIKVLEFGELGIDDLFETYTDLDYNEVENSEETLTPVDNGGQETIELYCIDEKGDGPIWTNKPTESEPESTYVLFGAEAVNSYDEGGVDGLSQDIEDNEVCAYELTKFQANVSVAEILYAGEGWDRYAIITKDEYNQLN